MTKHKQMPGITYQIISQSEERAEVEYTYICPYCMRKAVVQSVVFSPDFDRLESGGFYDELSCSECGKIADVRFWRTMRID